MSIFSIKSFTVTWNGGRFLRRQKRKYWQFSFFSQAASNWNYKDLGIKKEIINTGNQISGGKEGHKSVQASEELSEAWLN